MRYQYLSEVVPIRDVALTMCDEALAGSNRSGINHLTVRANDYHVSQGVDAHSMRHFARFKHLVVLVYELDIVEKIEHSHSLLGVRVITLIVFMLRNF